ncbi:1,4-dihydroxy-6-naphthoate synthase [Paenibacillus sp. MMS20-IR301]|uniref:1,4-dihydroxy-6-naphthoate synthase n=1 Tax=Paenibacillus sp. MMS20-IR301 TaxID=2895946 RepID=UPI0028E582B8|nr:1,4-dihydroxy-6-naphthoate synthase [Paenibacillus sp. MMS20-IR301]WNS42497.1 1,4-dihydroxy-6-naphthoate synthase [Paenibacillus sp. MMS20-IR301]
MTAELNIAFSPCPNDTFVFHAWAHGLVPDAPALNITYADINITNELAAEGRGPEVLKISYAALPWVLDNYRLLPCGGALGRGCGPLVLSRKGAGAIKHPRELSGRKIAVPSERSTAYLLFRLWAAQQVSGDPAEIIVMPFDEIMPAVQSGAIDAGLVIHEARFTYPSYNLQLLADLGSWWESDTGLPIPLGAIIARRDLDHEAITGWIRSSLQHAWDHPLDTQEYVLSHAQELSPEVAKSHIDLYVNEFSMNLGDDGYGAISALLNRAAAEGLVPAINPALLR